MKLKPHDIAEKGRIVTGLYSSGHGDRFGAFVVLSPVDRQPLRIIASDGSEEIRWEHVSVSRSDRTPTWEEMCFVKSLFWEKEEAVVQFHPPESEYINNHPNCLHLWAHCFLEIPLPPSIAVGMKALNA